MERLTLQEIAPYLPYGLKMQSLSCATFDDIYEVIGYRLDTLRFDGLSYDSDIIDFKPILRPMFLTTPIKIDGVEVVPIVELAKIAFPDDEFHIVQERCYSKDGLYRFDFIKSWFICGLYDGEWWRNENVINQLALFQWLFKNKFDVFGLIEKGLAVDVNTLETNPYEL